MKDQERRSFPGRFRLEATALAPARGRSGRLACSRRAARGVAGLAHLPGPLLTRLGPGIAQPEHPATLPPG